MDFQYTQNPHVSLSGGRLVEVSITLTVRPKKTIKRSAINAHVKMVKTGKVYTYLVGYYIITRKL
jgi:hypothetical protein